MGHHYQEDDPCWCEKHDDGMHDKVGCPNAREALQKAFNASPEELGAAAVAGARANRVVNFKLNKFMEAIAEICEGHQCSYDCFDVEGERNGYCKYAILHEIQNYFHGRVLTGTNTK